MSDLRTSQWLLAGVLVAVLAGGAYYVLTPPPEEKVEAPVTLPEPPRQVIREEPAPPEPEPQMPEADPIPVEPKPVPAELNFSDEPVRDAFLSLAPDSALAKWLVRDEVIRKWVAAIDSASRGNLMTKHRPMRNIRGPIKVESTVEADGQKSVTLSEQNYERYDTLVRIFALADTGTAVELYQFWYPRFSQAYGELGNKEKSFHKVMLKAIDVALAAPDLKGPIELVQPSVYYKFKDPKLEKLPGVHKLMIRMGPDNALRVKEKLRELKIELEKLPL
ncbi:DUF3014 domain-containing protein [Biformimicrobium ophioploci]|uniref:DUF3014 domain-containing protein n=1 Tax=Biformimicrobium ophioploci TaxID=3036711 RepID=A0ABQ6LZW3_9GAMM|nr:DUF3014 domain-containing protein [Microbulbifer sp. NKW57]GMG87577.1 hypothetical protein MNKW57_18980 [Microbulbifer sp. NKW57]